MATALAATSAGSAAPRQYAAELNRAKVAKKKAGQVLPFKSRSGGSQKAIASRPTESSGITESQMYPMGVASAEERKQKEAQNKANLATQRQSIKEETANITLPPIISEATDLNGGFERESMQNIRNLSAQDRQLQATAPGRIPLRRAMQKQKDAMVDKAMKKMSKKLKDEARDMASNLFGRGSAIDIPHEDGGFWVWLGSFATFFQVIKTFITAGMNSGDAISSATSGDIEGASEALSKDFFKGPPLNLIEPNALNMQKGTSWMSVLYAVILFFFLLAAFIQINIILAWFGLFIMIISEIVDVFTI
ncbi:MAG: hypothetical protein Q8P30_04560 [Candidatus Uhrbacteria bacterium]|nr:hypothetical protein [Candidatus Uhrbacteria bacterium]